MIDCKFPVVMFGSPSIAWVAGEEDCSDETQLPVGAPAAAGAALV